MEGLINIRRLFISFRNSISFLPIKKKITAANYKNNTDAERKNKTFSEFCGEKRRNCFISRVLLSVLLIMLFPVFSCSSGTPEKGTVTAGNTVISVEIVYTDKDRGKGLMNRKKLEPDSGMIFVFPYDRKLSFWMKNTSIPLSIAYISSDSVIKEIKDMTPFSLAPVNSKNSVRFALEVEKGYFEKNGIKEGDRLIFSDTILQALEKAED